MPKAEARARLRELFDIVDYNDIRRWGDEFLAVMEPEAEEWCEANAWIL